MKKKKGRPQQSPPKAKILLQAKASPSNRFDKLAGFFKWFFALIVLSLLVVVHWPVPSRSVTGGFGVWAECRKSPSVRLSGVLSNVSNYNIALSIAGLDPANCQSFKIAAPASTISIEKMIDLSDLSEEEMNKVILSGATATEPMPLKRVDSDGLQNYFDIDLSKIGSKTLNVAIAVEGVSAESFSRFRLLVGTAINKNEYSGEYLPILVDSIAIGKGFFHKQQNSRTIRL